MINLYMSPCREEDFPKSGGVREHIVQLRKQLRLSNKVQLLSCRAAQVAHIQHVEATYLPASVDLSMVYVCHGGFVPSPVPVVIRNLRRADVIISVADWLIKRFAPDLVHKVVVIPNGVDLSEFENLPNSGIEPGYVLYGKEWPYYFEDFLRLCIALPRQSFVTTAWPVNVAIPHNVTYIGRQPGSKMKSIIKDAGLVILTGSEVCPTLMLEAWAAGTPVLAKAIDGNAELMLPHGRGEVVGGLLYNKLSEAVEHVGTVLRYRNLMGDVGHQRVKSCYLWQDIVKAYEDVYERVSDCASMNLKIRI